MADIDIRQIAINGCLGGDLGGQGVGGVGHGRFLANTKLELSSQCLNDLPLR
jgi:hypothetical protein